MSGVDRRAFLKQVTAAAGAGALLRAEGAHAGLRAQSWSRATCPLCSVGCGLLVRIENGRAVAVKGDVDAEISRGLGCAKGYHAVQALYARDRIIRARIRRQGELVDAPLDEALALVAQRLRDTITQHGPGSVAFYSSAEWYSPESRLGRELFGGAVGAGFVDDEGRLDGGSGAAGLRTSFGSDAPIGRHADIEHADTFILWNQNLAETHPVLFSRILARRRTNAAVRIIDISTRTTRTSYAADRSILLAPQTELMLANAIAQALVTRRQVHRTFVTHHVAFRRGSAAPAAEESRATSWSGYVDFLADYTPERAQRTSGVRAEEIAWLASLYGDRSRRLLSIWGAGIGRQPRGTWTNNALYNLHLLTGRISAPGDNAYCVDVQQSAGDAARSVLPMFRALERGDVRFLWVLGADPLASLPDLRRQRMAAARKGHFLVVSDAFPTATTDAAHVVLPAALWLEDTLHEVATDGHVRQRANLIRPPGSAQPAAAQVLDVLRRAGYAKVIAPTATPAVEQPARRYRTAHDTRAAASHGEYDFYGHDDHRAWIWLRPHEPPPEPPAGDFPYWLESGPVLEHTGTGAWTRRIPTLHRAVPSAYAELNADDAKQLGIRNGDRIRLVSRRGSLVIGARVELRSQPPRGHVFVPQFDEAHPVNLLMPDLCCPLSGQPANAYTSVRVEPLGGGTS